MEDKIRKMTKVIKRICPGCGKLRVLKVVDGTVDTLLCRECIQVGKKKFKMNKCLNCSRVFKTFNDYRICPVCKNKVEFQSSDTTYKIIRRNSL